MNQSTVNMVHVLHKPTFIMSSILILLHSPTISSPFIPLSSVNISIIQFVTLFQIHHFLKIIFIISIFLLFLLLIRLFLRLLILWLLYLLLHFLYLHFHYFQLLLINYIVKHLYNLLFLHLFFVFLQLS